MGLGPIQACFAANMELSNEPLLAQKRDSNAVTTEESASCFARWTFRWLNRVFDTGYSRQLRFEDIPPLPGREAGPREPRLQGREGRALELLLVEPSVLEDSSH